MCRSEILKSMQHEIQVEHSIELSAEAKYHMDRLLWEYDDSRFKELNEQLKYWVERAKKAEMSNRHGCTPRFAGVS